MQFLRQIFGHFLALLAQTHQLHDPFDNQFVPVQIQKVNPNVLNNGDHKQKLAKIGEMRPGHVQLDKHEVHAPGHSNNSEDCEGKEKEYLTDLRNQQIEVFFVVHAPCVYEDGRHLHHYHQIFDSRHCVTAH